MTVFSREKEPNMIIFFSLPRPTIKVFPDTKCDHDRKIWKGFNCDSAKFLLIFILPQF